MCFIILLHQSAKCVSSQSDITLKSVFHYTQALRCIACFIILSHYAAKCVSLYTGITLQHKCHNYQALRCKVSFNKLEYYAPAYASLYVSFYLTNPAKCVHYTQTLHYKLCLIILGHNASKCVLLHSNITLQSMFDNTQALG